MKTGPVLNRQRAAILHSSLSSLLEMTDRTLTKNRFIRRPLIWKICLLSAHQTHLAGQDWREPWQTSCRYTGSGRTSRGDRSPGRANPNRRDKLCCATCCCSCCKISAGQSRCRHTANHQLSSRTGNCNLSPCHSLWLDTRPDR